MLKLPNWLVETPIAHRGLHDQELPENSLGAFEAAMRAGYAIELDIHCSADKELVVFHDVNTKRMTGFDAKVIECKASYLQGLKLFDGKYYVPMLAEILEVVNGKVPVLIEIKTGTPASKICPILVSLLKGYHGQVAVQSFDPSILRWFKVNAPAMPRGQLSAAFKDEKMSFLKKSLLKNMYFNILSRPHFIAYAIYDVPSRAVSLWLRILSVPLLVWTVKSTNDQKLAADYRANIIFENIRPSL